VVFRLDGRRHRRPSGGEPVILASVTGQITTWIAAHGVIAVFALMAVDAVLPIGGELVMLFAGVIAAGVIGSSHPTLFGATLSPGVAAYLVLSIAGALGSLAGSLAGWWLGRWGGRPLIERHGRKLHITPAKFARAERWFDRYGVATLLVGRLTPLVRSFISIPAGVLGSKLVPFAALTLLASLIWSFGFAAAGWALGGTWHSFDGSFRYLDYAVLAALAGMAVVVALRLRSRSAQPAGGRPEG
jgi:membrane protein DedA with SNARE-associated domain